LRTPFLKIRKNNDECYTPAWPILQLLEIFEIPKNKIIWCPFDLKTSAFVTVLKSEGYQIVFSHIFNNQDFFNYEPPNWDIIISNPPFTNKRLFLERCFSFNKPFILLFGAFSLAQHGKTLNYLWNQLSFYFIDKPIEFVNKIKKVKFNCIWAYKNVKLKKDVIKYEQLQFLF